jgi:hypothetical protein
VIRRVICFALKDVLDPERGEVFSKGISGVLGAQVTPELIARETISKSVELHSKNRCVRSLRRVNVGHRLHEGSQKFHSFIFLQKGGLDHTPHDISKMRLT